MSSSRQGVPRVVQPEHASRAVVSIESQENLATCMLVSRLLAVPSTLITGARHETIRIGQEQGNASNVRRRHRTGSLRHRARTRYNQIATRVWLS